MCTSIQSTVAPKFVGGKIFGVRTVWSQKPRFRIQKSKITERFSLTGRRLGIEETNWVRRQTLALQKRNECSHCEKVCKMPVCQREDRFKRETTFSKEHHSRTDLVYEPMHRRHMGIFNTGKRCFLFFLQVLLQMPLQIGQLFLEKLVILRPEFSRLAGYEAIDNVY